MDDAVSRVVHEKQPDQQQQREIFRQKEAASAKQTGNGAQTEPDER